MKTEKINKSLDCIQLFIKMYDVCIKIKHIIYYIIIDIFNYNFIQIFISIFISNLQLL